MMNAEKIMKIMNLQVRIWRGVRRRWSRTGVSPWIVGESRERWERGGEGRQGFMGEN